LRHKADRSVPAHCPEPVIAQESGETCPDRVEAVGLRTSMPPEMVEALSDLMADAIVAELRKRVTLR
jgi:hypothetical protein